MKFSKKKRVIVTILLVFFSLVGIAVGGALGIALALSSNFETFENFSVEPEDLPTRILDINGNLITEFFAEEKREMISVKDLPRYLIHAVLTREDADFFTHKGFSVKGMTRAAFLIVTGQLVSGGSTITQQLAKHLYCEPSDRTLDRKLKELWYSFQIERMYSKYEILERYLNKMPFGHGTYGVETASEHFFGHSSLDLSLAESVMLAIQLVRLQLYSPFTNPNGAKVIQGTVLDQMVSKGYISPEKRDSSFQEYWDNFKHKPPTGVYYNREDKARHFSEYVRQRILDLLYGALDIYRDGFVVHTTLDLDYQKVADDLMNQGINRVNSKFRSGTQVRLDYVDDNLLPVIEMMSLNFNMGKLKLTGQKNQRDARKYFNNELVPAMNAMSLMLNISETKGFTTDILSKQQEKEKIKHAEGALITIENETGHIKAMIGGEKFDSTSSLNRATQAYVDPGSCFKPLYYAEAIESKKFTAASVLFDGPVYFHEDDGSLYTPTNYSGRWYGNIRIRSSLALSLNIPSILILDAVGFDPAISMSSRLLGISDPEYIALNFPKVYPLALGITPVSPIQMAQAFATFANQGMAVEPIAIRYIEDRDGNIVVDHERELREEHKRLGESRRVMSPQGAYIMTDMLQQTVKSGTLMYRAQAVGGFNMPMAGKTGTTQNWSDAWTIGYSPYMTTAVWFGFDEDRGYSLGRNQSGSVAAGPIWADFMKATHENLPPKEFSKPQTGLIEVDVCRTSGKLKIDGLCNEGTIKEIFITNTEPKSFCDIHEYRAELEKDMIDKMENSLFGEDFLLDSSNFLDDKLNLDLDLGSMGFDFIDPTSSLLEDDKPFIFDDEGADNSSREDNGSIDEDKPEEIEEPVDFLLD